MVAVGALPPLSNPLSVSLGPLAEFGSPLREPVSKCQRPHMESSRAAACQSQDKALCSENWISSPLHSKVHQMKERKEKWKLELTD